MTTPETRQDVLRSLIYPLLRPVYYPTRYYYRLLLVRAAGLNVSQARPISMGCSHDDMAERIKVAISPRVHWIHVRLNCGQIRENLDSYYRRHRQFYLIEKGRTKALEHALGLELLDFNRVKRYCDVASCASRMQKTLATHYQKVEFWSEQPDPEPETNLSRQA
jgi:hypothetical protein